MAKTKTPINIRFEEKLLKKLRDEALLQKTTLTAVIENACQFWLKHKDNLELQKEPGAKERLEGKLRKYVESLVSQCVQVEIDLLKKDSISAAKEYIDCELKKLTEKKN